MIRTGLIGAALSLLLLSGTASAQGTIGAPGGAQQDKPKSQGVQEGSASGGEERVVEPDPGNVVNYRNEQGLTFYFEVTGSLTGSVWGSGIYTDDSHIGTAAVHAGLLEPDETGVVALTILGPQQSFEGTTGNGVTSADYGPWDGSFQFVSEEAAEHEDEGGSRPPLNTQPGRAPGR